MCPVQWRKPASHPAGPSFLRTPPNRVVVFLTKPDEHATLLLHWLGDGKGSFPCLGEGECSVCPSGRFLHAYCGVLVWNGKTRSWSKAILDLGNPAEGIAQTDWTGMPLVVGRGKSGKGDNRLIQFGTPDDETIAIPKNVEPFDVRPCLMRRWGLFDEADRVLREAYYEQARLPFPGSSSGKEAAS